MELSDEVLALWAVHRTFARFLLHYTTVFKYTQEFVANNRSLFPALVETATGNSAVHQSRDKPANLATLTGMHSKEPSAFNRQTNAAKL